MTHDEPQSVWEFRPRWGESIPPAKVVVLAWTNGRAVCVEATWTLSGGWVRQPGSRPFLANLTELVVFNAAD